MGAPAFSHQTYTIQRPFWSILGRRFHVYAPDGSLVIYVKHPLFKLKQEFTLFADEAETRPVLTVRSRAIIALNMHHDVFDAATGQKVGSIKSRGLKSILRDTWDILDANDQPMGLFQEDSNALLRRFFPFLLSHHHIELNGRSVGQVDQRFRFFIKEFTLDLSANNGQIDPRFAICCALMALMAESAREAQS